MYGCNSSGSSSCYGHMCMCFLVVARQRIKDVVDDLFLSFFFFFAFSREE